MIIRDGTDNDGRTHHIRVGVTSVMPPQVETWNADVFEGQIVAQDIIPAAKAAVKRLRRKGAGVVVLLAHTSLGTGRDDPSAEHGAAALAARSGADVIVSGHGHKAFPLNGAEGLINGVPVVNPGYQGSHLGVVELELKQASAGWRVTADPGYLIENPGKGTDGAVEKAALAAHGTTQRIMKEPLGTAHQRISSHFSMVQPDRVTALVQDAKKTWVESQLQGTPWQDWPVVSAVAPFKAGGQGGARNYTDVPAVELTMRSVSDLCPYPNDIAAIEITGAGLRDWLERSVSIYQRFAASGGRQLLLDPAGASYLFDVISDLTWEIDLASNSRFLPDGQLAAQSNRRIRAVRYNGRPLDDRENFVLVTNSYRVGGGGQFPGAVTAPRVPLPTRTIRDILADYIRTCTPVDIIPTSRWRFTSLPGAEAMFYTAPTADPADCPLAHRHSTVSDGFVGYSLAL